METMPLLRNIDGSNEKKELTQNYDDSSSGYESTDTWDLDSISSRDSNGDADSLCGLDEDFERSCEIESKSMKVSCSNQLSDSMKLILAMPDLCDVTFLVGPEETPVHGLRAVMAARSKVFQRLIFEQMHVPKEKKAKKQKRPLKSKSRDKRQCSLTERLMIPVHEYDVEVFHMLLQFVHTGTAYVTQQNVSGLLCGAEEFELPELADVCWEFVENCLSTGEAESLLVPTRAYSQHLTSRQIFDKIYAVLDERFTSPYQPNTSTRKMSALEKPVF